LVASQLIEDGKRTVGRRVFAAEFDGIFKCMPSFVDRPGSNQKIACLNGVDGVIG